MKIKNILLINAQVSQDEEYCDCANSISFPHLGLIQIASNLKDKFPHLNVTIIDMEISGFKKTRKIINEIMPDIVGISTLTSSYSNAIKIAHYAKIQIGAIVVLGNDHASFVPSYIIKNRAYVDYIIAGDNGDIDFVEFIACLFKDKDPRNEVFNLWGRKNNIPYFTKNRSIPLSKKNNYTAYPAINGFNYIDFDRYKENYNVRFGKFHSKIINPITVNNTKGCVNGKNNCLYCSIYDLTVQSGDPICFWIMLEEYYFNFGYNFFFEVCDNFGGMVKYQKELINHIPSWFKGSNVELMVYSTALDLVRNKEVIPNFKQLNIKRVNLGLDSMDANTLFIHRKNHPTSDAVKINLEAIKCLNESNIQMHISFVLGCLGEDEASMMKTIDFIHYLCNIKNVVTIEISTLYPMPKSPAWDIFLYDKNSTYYKDGIDEIFEFTNMDIHKSVFEKNKFLFAERDDIDLNLAAEIWANEFTKCSYTKQVDMVNKTKNLILSSGKIFGSNL